MFVELLNAVQRRFNRWLETRDVEDLLDPADRRMYDDKRLGQQVEGSANH